LYSTTFKKKILTGNVIIAALTAWTILILYFAVNNTYFLTGGRFAEIKIPLLRIYKFVVMYAGFAFIISLIREIIKDMEDVAGDEKYNCKTMPIVWGINAAKIFASVWMVVLIAGLIVLQFYLLQLKWWMSAAYCALLIILPLISLLKRLVNAQYQQQFHQLSNQVKWVMLAGILFMIFIRYYYV
jgi:4-hydroxybenzoate polyprenyltransferase